VNALENGIAEHFKTHFGQEGLSPEGKPRRDGIILNDIFQKLMPPEEQGSLNQGDTCLKAQIFQ